MFASLAQQLNAVTIGAPGRPDPQSGAIMKVLSNVDGFAERVGEGVKNGHTYRVIHVPGQSDFILEDSYPGQNGKRETRRQIFKIMQVPVSAETPRSADPIELLFDDLEASMDDIISLAKS